MSKFISLILDFLFPPSEDELIVRNLTASDITYLFKHEQSEGFVSLSHFRNPAIRALIHEAKFYHNKKAFKLLNILISRFLEGRESNFDVIIPIPLSRKRQRERGHNQVVSILTSSTLPIPVLQDTLLRTRHTQPQTNLDKRERLTNLKGAFTLNPKHELRGKHILLVDDVATTGTTLKEARTGLLQADPASITCLALAH